MNTSEWKSWSFRCGTCGCTYADGKLRENVCGREHAPCLDKRCDGTVPPHWQKEVPSKSGQYWTATRDGLDAGLRGVAYDEKGRLLFAGSTRESWLGWWWSEPVVPPAPPAKDEWEET